MKKKYVLGILLLFYRVLLAQSSICGSIICQGETVDYARIVCLENNHAVMSNIKGEFCIDLNTFPSHLEISCLGFNKKKITVSNPTEKLEKIEIVRGTFEANEVIISATRTNEKQGATFQMISKAELSRLNIGQDLPYVLQYTPSAVNTSDAGNGIGYTSLRIRGTDATRINTTVNGVPVNDAESQGTFWVDFPDLASSAQSIQIQRGVGTSSNGSGAFGASINIQTLQMRDSSYAQSINNFGSFNSLRSSLIFGTGVLNNHFTLNGRLSKINSDGFIDRANSDMKSMYLDASYFSKKFSLHYVNFSGIEKTFQAWNGIPQTKYDGDINELRNHYYNNLGFLYLTSQDSVNLFSSNNNTYNYFTYKNQADNYNQYNHQLHSNFTVNRHLLFNISVHYTRGMGYYEEFKYKDALSNYGLASVIIGTDTIQNSSLIRQKWLDNYFYGITYSFIYKKSRFTSILGGSSNQYLGRHFTNVIWSEFASSSHPDSKIDYNSARKTDASFFAKNIFQLNEKTSLYADLQYRYVNYQFQGYNEIFEISDQEVTYPFFNPKAGISYDLSNKQNLYISYSVAHREPMRDDFVSSTPSSRALPERLDDLEVGYKFSASKAMLQLVAYYMNYKNQLVLTGMINDVGSYTRTNVAKSYRSGIELLAEYRINQQLKLFANATFSQNKILNFKEYVYGYFSSSDSISTTVNSYNNSDIAFSPSIIGLVGCSIKPIKGFECMWITKYVGKQYLDNTSNSDKSIAAYLLSDFKISYHLDPTWCKVLSFQINVNNVFNHRYVSNGYTYSSMYDGNLIRENFVYPQAGINLMGGFTIGF